MDQLLKNQVNRIINGNRFGDRHPTFTMLFLLAFMLVSVGAAAFSFVLFVAGFLSLLEIQSVFDRFAINLSWWGLLFVATGLAGVARVVMAYGIILHRRWI